MDLRLLISARAALRSGLFVTAAVTAFEIESVNAQVRRRIPPDSAQRDSIAAVRLGEIVVSARAEATVVPPHTEARIEGAGISRRNATVVADFARMIPAAHVQTNSRGETLVYLRNAGERQVSVFFDGALLNVPWDNRVDLSLVPATVVGGMTVAKGVPPVEYGANVLGGAVNLTPRVWTEPYPATELVTQYGTQQRQALSVTHQARHGRMDIIGTLAYTAVDGMPVPDDADLAFSQPSDALRTNTDSRITNFFASAAYDFGGGTRAGVALIHVDSRKGIAPEGHLDPQQSRVRFWRYPDWTNSMLIVNGQGLFGNTMWKGAAWGTVFGQMIESYDSSSYDALEATQEDDDLTFGTRFTIANTVGPGTVKVALNALTSTHKQRDVDANADPAVTFPRLEFKQHVISTGVEYAFEPAMSWSVTVGASFDAMFAPKTGDKPDRGPFADYSLTGGIAKRIGEGWTVRGAVGRKTRFPTMRELFGDALDRFVLNPDLTSESSTLVELAIGFEGETVSAEIVPFGTFTTNAIDQRNVLLDGETRTRRQRINAAGSRVIGVELVGTSRLTDDLTIHAHLTVMDIRRLQDAPTDPTVISEKPNALARASAIYHTISGFSIDIEAIYTGRAYSLNDQDEFVALPKSTALNLRIAQEVHVGPSRIEVFARGNNVTDAVLVPQLGLPEAGRHFHGGVKMTF